MSVSSLAEGTGSAASRVLGGKLDSIPFSGYQVLIIAVLALVGFIEGYDLVMTGSLLVLAKGPLHLTGSDIRWLIFGPTVTLTIGGFFFSALSDHLSRKMIVLIGVIATTFFTLMIRARRRRRGLGGVSDRRRVDAGAAPPHLWRDL